jgi:hypothetical protein
MLVYSFYCFLLLGFPDFFLTLDTTLSMITLAVLKIYYYAF